MELPEDKRMGYLETLADMLNYRDFAMLTATPRQRAETLVKVLGGGE